MSQNEEHNTEALKSTPANVEEQQTPTTTATEASSTEPTKPAEKTVTPPETEKKPATFNGFSYKQDILTQPRTSKAIAIVNPDTREIVNPNSCEVEGANNEAKKTEKDEESKKKEEEERIAAITAEKASRATGPGRLDMSAIPPHVFHDSPVSTPTSPSAPSETPAEAPPAKKASVLASPLAPPMATIDDTMSIEYPPEFLAPKPFEEGKIAYEKTFLLQFQPLCPETMFDLSDFQSLMESHQGDRRGNNGGRRQNSERGGRGPRTPSGGQSMSRHGSRDGRGEMGKFASGGRQLSHRSGSNGPNSPGGMERQGSHGGRSRSGRGKGRHNTKQQEGGPTIPLDQVVPLEKSENRWVAKATSDNPEELKTEDDLVPQDIVTRKVKSLLNKLTLEKFDSISDQIVKYALQSEKEDDGTSLRNVVNLIFDKAVDEAAFAAMWARLSRKLLVVVTESSSLKDVNCLDKEGNLQSPMLVFRTYLLNRCQREFLEGWNQDMPELDTNNTEVMMSDEYYAAAKKKRRGLGLVVYIGEMYKLNILSSKIMRQCIHRLVSDPMEVEDAEAETLCKFLTTVGKQMETDNADSKNLLDQTFGVMKVMQTQSEKLSSRVKFMILDMFDLRKDKWMSKNSKQPAPTTIAQIHEQAKKANDEKEIMKRQSSSRGPSSRPISRQSSQAGTRDMKRQSSAAGKNIKKQPQNRGGDDQTAGDKGGDGWSTVGSGISTPVRSGSRNDLANFGKTDRSKSKAGSNVLSPSASPFSSLARNAKSSANDKKSNAASESRGTTAMNMFSALGGDGEDEEEEEVPVVRKKLELLPRSQPAEGEDNDEEEDEKKEEAAPEKPRLSDDLVARRSKNTIDEYFSLRDKTELGECIKELECSEHRVIFASKLLDIVEQKSSDVDVACEIITELYNQKLMQKEEYVVACKKFMEGYEDLILDVPQASKHVNTLLTAMGIDRSEVEPEEI